MSDDGAVPDLEDQLARSLLRFFRPGAATTLTEARLSLREDVEYLRIHWAFSPQVEALAAHLLERRHELQTSLENRVRDDEYVVRGRLAPARTALRRLMTGDPAALSYFEPVRSYRSGPNHVLIWVLQQAHAVLQRYFGLLSRSTQHNERVERVLYKLHAIRQLTFVGQAAHESSMRLRPSGRSVSQAGQSRKQLYRLAHGAYTLLTRMEDGEEDAVLDVINKTLIGPLEDWRRFELLVALRMAEALATASGLPVVLYPITPGSSAPIASVGKYDIFWQSRTKHAKTPEPEPTELLVNEVLAGYGLGAGWDQPDVVVLDREAVQVVGLAEAKYYGSGESVWKDAFRAAVAQVVRYVRLYEEGRPGSLLGNTLLALKYVPLETKALATNPGHPVALDLTDLTQGNLRSWADRILGGTSGRDHGHSV